MIWPSARMGLQSRPDNARLTLWRFLLQALITIKSRGKLVSPEITEKDFTLIRVAWLLDLVRPETS
jgi:hypothetical protein